MKRYFNTKELAHKHLEYRKKCAYERIQRRGDYVLGDASFVYRNEKNKWVAFVQIVTLQMIRDLEKIKGGIEYAYPLIPFTPAEKIVKNETQIKQLEKKYKTLDIEDYIINKDI